MEDFHHSLCVACWLDRRFDLTCKPGVLELHGLSGHVSGFVSGARAVAIFPCLADVMYYVDAQGVDCQHLVFGIMQWKPSFRCCKQGCHADSINHLTTGTKAGYGGQLRMLSTSLLAELDEGGVFPLAYHDGRIPSGAMRFRRACWCWWRLNRRWACPLKAHIPI